MIDRVIARVARLMLICAGLALCTAALAEQKKAGNDAASLAGDWEYDINGPVKMVLHLEVGANGALAGTIDTPASPPQHVVLRDIQLSGKILKYTWPQLGTMMEVVQADGNSMLGTHIWHRVNTSALSARDVAGDWESKTSSGTYSRVTHILHLRLDSSGSLTGSVDELLAIPRRIPLREVRLQGMTLTYTLDNGDVLHGTFSNDRRMIFGDQSGLTWQRSRTLAQALVADSKEHPLPTDGTWSGIITPVLWSVFVKTPPKGDFRLVVHLRSAPVSCSVSLGLPTEIQGGPDGDRPCEMKREGANVQIFGPYAGAFIGTLSGDQLTGTWTTGENNPVFMMALSGEPMKVRLTRSVTAAATH
jgi:hypothetical protein